MDPHTAILPLITVGITAYNAAGTIEAAVESALAQNWKPKEIIVVNDASSDCTGEILDALASKFPDIRVIHHPENKGVAGARNTIIREARGTFLAFFDDDDRSDPMRLDKQYLRIVSYEEKYAGIREVICHCSRIQHYPDGSEHYEPTAGMNEDGLCPRGEAMAKRILYGLPVENGFGSMASCSQMARLSTYQTLDGFDEDFRRCEDTDFNVRFAQNGGHFAGIAEPMVHQTMTPGNDKTLTQDEDYYRKLIIKHAIFIRNSGVSPLFCSRWLDAKYAYLRGKKGLFFWKIIKLFFKYPRLTYRRMKWAWPNKKFNKHAQEFYKSFS
ncbi:MAG: glycosyltransferase family 2 protein [Alphaproteobacteria bacterium]|nr:glycosyltransferase family 2 protein [Alphaproteobacteria bacterium]MBP7759984.1 glycosyltransferase family 2 protein [Alphaproteobacteria bacterium]MBP7763350.1 glycosyltransferase family 2 protein [Alphaproteobacteria bacterium]MBP7905335.1 glycosyltransferase family 2 protein [Alphaproteobacteria bacterium]